MATIVFVFTLFFAATVKCGGNTTRGTGVTIIAASIDLLAPTGTLDAEGEVLFPSFPHYILY
jgi:hypothetical protein